MWKLFDNRIKSGYCLSVMVIYVTTFDYKDIKMGTKLTFNRSMQYFETSNHDKKITNDESYHNPNLIKILKEYTQCSESKRLVINIPF